MYDYFKINNTWRSDQVEEGVHLLSFKLPSLLPTVQRQTEPSETLLCPQGKKMYKPQILSVELGAITSNLADNYALAIRLSRELSAAECIELSDIPGIYFRGDVQEIKVLEQEDEWLRLGLEFALNPPCLNKLVGASSTMLLPSKGPIAEQITESNASFALNVSAPQEVQIAQGTHETEIYAMLIGSWDSLKIGALELPEMQNRAVYIDKEAQQAYLIEGGKRINAPNQKGLFALLNHENKLKISGENLNLKAYIYAIERI